MDIRVCARWWCSLARRLRVRTAVVSLNVYMAPGYILCVWEPSQDCLHLVKITPNGTVIYKSLYESYHKGIIQVLVFGMDDFDEVVITRQSGLSLIVVTSCFDQHYFPKLHYHLSWNREWTANQAYYLENYSLFKMNTLHPHNTINILLISFWVLMYFTSASYSSQFAWTDIKVCAR